MKKRYGKIGNSLLEPRFEIISDFPGNNIGKVGDIIKGNKYKNRNMHLFPNLFRQVEWWEKREENQMPKKVKIKDFIYEVEKWDMDKMEFTSKQGEIHKIGLRKSIPIK